MRTDGGCALRQAAAPDGTSLGTAGGVPSGSVNVTRAPPPGMFAAHMRPWWASTIPRLIASPRPTPGVADSRAPRVNFSKIDSSCHFGDARTRVADAHDEFAVRRVRRKSLPASV